MGKIFAPVLGLLRRLGADRDGVAAVEFALVLPLMLLVYIGAVEGSTLISMDRRVQIISGSLGDLVARSNGSIVSASLQNYFKAAQGTMLPYSTATLIQVVSSVQVNADGSNKIVWSREYTSTGMDAVGKSRVAGQTYALPAQIIAVAKGKWVIVSESYYTWKPVSGFVYTASVPLYRENFYVPRFDNEIKLDP